MDFDEPIEVEAPSPCAEEEVQPKVEAALETVKAEPQDPVLL